MLWLFGRCLLHLESGVAVGRLYHRSVDELVLEPLPLILILRHHWLLILHRRLLLNHLVELRQLELRITLFFGLDRLNLLEKQILLLLLLVLNHLYLVDQSIIVAPNIVL